MQVSGGADGHHAAGILDRVYDVTVFLFFVVVVFFLLRLLLV